MRSLSGQLAEKGSSTDLRQVIDEDGVTGLLGRGLQTRLLVNALQGTIFAVLWKYFEQRAS